MVTATIEKTSGSGPPAFGAMTERRPRLERLRDDPALRRSLHMPRPPRALRQRLQTTLTDSDTATAGTGTAKRDEARISAEQRLVQRATLGLTQSELAEVASLGYYPWIDRQLEPDTIDDFGLEALLDEVLPSIAMSPYQRLATYLPDNMLEIPVFELILAALVRAIYSPRQLLERMVIFWTDHFHVDLLSDFGPLLKPTDEREVIRPHALGRFRDLLHASAKSPAMLSYLTNDSNVAGHPNENYARELMELHTLGEDRGYTQDDVREVARCFTGWTLDVATPGPRWGRFRFVPALHDDGEKVVLGQRIAAGGGVADGERVLDILAGHDNTARHVSEKLARYLFGYDPEPGLLDRLTDAFVTSDGDIRVLLREALRREWMARATPKLKRPFHHAVSALRALGAELRDPFTVLLTLYDAGHLPYTWSPPNGFPDSEGYWSGYILPRWRYGAELLRGEAAPAVYDSPFLLRPELSPSSVARRLSWLLTNGGFAKPTFSAVRRFLLAGPADPERRLEAIGLALASPEFQRY